MGAGSSDAPPRWMRVEPSPNFILLFLDRRNQSKQVLLDARAVHRIIGAQVDMAAARSPSARLQAFWCVARPFALPELCTLS